MPGTNPDVSVVAQAVIDGVDEVHRFAAETANRCHVHTADILKAALRSVGADLDRDTEKPTTRDGDIPLREAQVIWQYEGRNALAPPVVVMGHPDESGRDRWGNPDDKDYLSSWGACSADFNEASDEERMLMLFKQFHWMVLTREVGLQAVHEAFLVIPEYRAQMPRDFLPAEYREEP